ncbi:hypothetical protein ABVK25_010652 [Lepraria finkii]|uniref:Uncharacterized protein n=1 Tax=Lepraria finkii TaxID=1340010 RepID=A0ABR4AW55_9LECA
MPKPPVSSNPFACITPYNFPRRLLRFHSLLHLMRLPTGIQSQLHILRMHQDHHDALPDAVEGGYGGVGAADAVVGYGANAGGHKADAGVGREEEVREEGLR